ncbi:reverse transcriptase domain-containing protein [Tanacetum coccineum]
MKTTLAIPLDKIHIDEKLNFIEEPTEIMDREVKRLKQSRIPIVKVRWNLRRGPKYTWEREDQMQKKYPHLFANPVNKARVVMSSAKSAITYTSIYTDSEPGRAFWGADDEEISKGAPLVPQDEDEREPMFVQAHDPDYEDQRLYEDDEIEDGPVDYPMDGGDDGDDDDGDSSRDDADEDEDDEDEDDEDEEEEEEHLALADSTIVAPVDEPVFPPEGTETVIPPPSIDITIAARITVRPQISISLPPEAEVERLLAMTTPITHHHIIISHPLQKSAFARIVSTQALIDAVTAALPSPSLPPLPPSLYIPPPIEHRDDILESKQPPRKRLCLSTLGSRYEIRENSTARPTRGRGIDYGFVNTIVAEERRQGIRDIVWVTKLAELHEHDTQDLYALLEDARDKMSDMQDELLSLREQQRRARQPGPEARIPDHQDAFGDADNGSHSSHGDNRRNVQTTRPCFYADFMKCQHLNFKGAEGVVGLTRWIEKMESVFNISGCAIKNQVKFATCTLLGAALTWWNGQIRTLGPEAYAMTWEVLKKKMTDKYCPQCEIKKLEIELWNLKVKGNDVPAYTERFQELTLICTKFVANETEKVDKYISGLPDNIYGNVKSARPKTLDETIELANDLMDQKLRTYAERQSDNKRKADDSSRNNHGHPQQPFKRQNVAKVYNMGTGERKPYVRSLPKCTKFHLHHNGPCTQKCHKCNKVGHFARDCRSTGNANVANTQKGNRAAPKGNGCFECGALGHFKRDCPKLKNKDGGNGNAQGWVYAVGNAEKRGNASGNPDANVVTGTFLLNNHYASILFDTGADRSFISTAFSSLINIAPTPLENCYDVKLADGKLVGIDTII